MHTLSKAIKRFQIGTYLVRDLQLNHTDDFANTAATMGIKPSVQPIFHLLCDGRINEISRPNLYGCGTTH